MILSGTTGSALNLTKNMSTHITTTSPSVITKRDLVLEISDQLDLTQMQVMDVVQLLVDTVTNHLAQGEEVVIRKFGTFKIAVSRSKIGRNPNKPANEVLIPARAVVKFKPGSEMRDEVAKLMPSPAPVSLAPKKAAEKMKRSA